jgi:asparagine synthase (glutamine-hydrolysing)
VCGIAGVKLFNKIASKTDEARMEEALKTQHHRGPDSCKVLVDGSVVLGHNRLAIIDTNTRSNQPFRDESGRYSLVFNGEIYNFHELKEELVKEGLEFKTTSDTEVLFYLLIKYKAAALDFLRGCFAFALYDNAEEYLLLARDRMGINPLLFAFDEDKLVFGSEMSVFPVLGVQQSISHQALNYYFQYTYIPAPFTIYEEVQKLLPGHYIELRGTAFHLKKYWDPKSPSKFTGNFDEAKIALKQKVEYAVTSQLEADVPIGTFLSGGVDSSIVSAIVSEVKPDLHTFSVSFGDQQQFDESAYALKVAKHIHSNHHVIRLQEQDFKQHFYDVLDAFDEPFADSSAIAMWFLAKETSQHLKVALSGDGADELFAGYNKHKAYLQTNSYSPLKKNIFSGAMDVGASLLKKSKPTKAHKLNKFSNLLKLQWPDNYWFLASNIGEKSKNSLLKNSFKSQYLINNQEDDLNSFLYKDQLFVLSNDMLKKVDLMSMQHSLEVRTPFMDEDLVKFANSLPSAWKLHPNGSKYILKETFKNSLPEEIFTRGKQGFEVPLNAWIKTNWNLLIPNEWFESAYLVAQGIFALDGVERLKRQFFKNIGTANQEMWAYIVFQHWYQKKYSNA